MRLVVKIGTNLLTEKTGSLNEKLIGSITKDLAKLKKAGAEIVIVTSGSIGAGMGKLKIHKRPNSLREKQALAAIGQPLLMDIYQEKLGSLGIDIAQVLLTRHDFHEREQYINARDTLFSLLELGVIPIVNENDTVAIEEINFGDNDTLSALVAATISADYLFMLTDVDGLHKGAPGKGELLSTVEKITSEIENHATDKSESGKGTGGMKTKISAAKIAISSGVKTVIAKGTESNIISRIVNGEQIGTTFVPSKAMCARKSWIAFGPKCKGKISIDDGAVKALTEKGKSLLPSGITSVNGKFGVGDTISIVDSKHKEIARGLTYYSSKDIEKMKGKKSEEIKKILPHHNFEEIVHRDNLVTLNNC
ncbi:glutamate 5-kinase [Elusimicrobiota bacterium]